MTETPEQPTAPIGIDLGTAKTVAARPADGEYQLLRTGESDSIPTAFALAEDGFVIGQEASDRPDSVTPLPYVERTEQSMTATPADVPLAIFLEKLREVWDGPSTDTQEPNGDPSVDTEDENPQNDPADGQGDETEESTTASDSPLKFSAGPPDDSPEDDQEASDSPPSDGQSDSSPEQSTSLSGAYNPTTITVPGGYSADDIAEVESIASGAGFGDVTAVRNPLAIAAAESLDVDSETTLGVVDIGTQWAEFAVITIDSAGGLTVQARTNLLEHGRTALDGRLAQWALKQVESEHDLTLECTDTTRQRLREAVHEAADQVTPDGESTGSIDLQLDDGVSITEGGLFGMDAIPVQEEFDLETCVQALRPMLEEIQQTVTSMLDDLPDTDVDELVLAGDGTQLAPVLIAIENAFGIRSRPPTRGDRYTAPAIGAAVLSERRKSGLDPIDREVISDTIVLQALGEDGPEPRPLSNTATGQGDIVTGRLIPTTADQLSGVFQLGRQHRITGELEELRTYSCTNIPSNADTSTLLIEAEPTTALIDGEAVRVSASVETTADRDTELSVQETTEASHPWLAHAGTDTDELPTADDSNDAPASPTSDRMKALESVDGTGVARAAWKMRNRIWEQTVRTGESLTEKEIQLFLRELDKNLRIEGVEIIEPDVGDRLDTDRHSVGRAEEADEPEGTILEVLSPGFAVEGTVIEPAEVKAAR